MSLNSGKRWLTFDCYDTLVRYTESKFAAMTDLISAKGGTKDLVESVWSVFQSSERRLQTDNFLLLNQVLKKRKMLIGELLLIAIIFLFRVIISSRLPKMKNGK